MSFFDNLKKIKEKVDQVDSAVSTGSQSLLAVYEKNLKLEKEIAIRTKELDRVNKQMLTLQHIWEMMNSSKPLSSVLNAIVNSLQSDLGYKFSFILEEQADSNGSYLQAIAYSRGDLGELFSNYVKTDIADYKLKFPNIAEVQTSFKEDKIFQSSNVSKFISEMVDELREDVVEQHLKKCDINSYILLPLSSNHFRFGSLVVLSSRDETSAKELSFLGLFAKQIEMAITIADLFQTVKEQAITDSMTELYNRRYFEDFIKKEAIRAERQNQKFTVIGLDLDHLKQINDTYGHAYGDLAIKTIANVLKSNARSIDIPARIGGEEFNLILPGVDSKGGMIAAERIRKAIQNVKLDKIGNITASLGVATYLEHTDDIDELLEITDRAMYESKWNGRNRVTLAKPSAATSWQSVAINTFVDILSKHRIPIDDNMTDMLIEKLQDISKDKVYQVADALVSTYNPEHQDGVVKQKVQIATLLAKRFELSKEAVDRLKIAVLLYDIGNTMLPHEILSKKEPLTEMDKESIRQHPIIAAREILKPIANIVDVIPIIEKHHENWDGSGYPNNLAGNSIPIESQIILIIDSYFALLEKRPYREAKSPHEALMILEQDVNEKWSEKLVKEFISIVKNDFV